MLYALPGTAGAPYSFKDRYDNFIGGKWVPPVKGEYFPNVSPVTGKRLCDAARSTAEDIELALDAAHAAFPKWAATPPAQRSAVLLKCA
ncbi:MAG: aldehyde dehydrogenase family protein, partial [Zoogloeaceae bacterium]|nr:aldehyde dehydrogenase family protein [Zoogloeaceae bacterium]